MRHTFPFSIFIISFCIYTLLTFLISWLTTRNIGKKSFFSGNRKTPWPIIAYGMLGASISGITFISVPGNVLTQNFYYMPMVLGFILGYYIVAKVLIPVFYKKNVISIYSYLGQRFGRTSQTTGSIVFMLANILSTGVRIFMLILVLFTFVPRTDPLTFALIAFIFVILLFLYTFKGGVKTIIWTDVMQTTLLLLAAVLTFVVVWKKLDLDFNDLRQYTSMFEWQWSSPINAVKQFVAGVFIVIAMTGLDQSMMQKNLACKNIRSAQKNLMTTSIIILVVNYFFLLLGAVLAIFVKSHGGMEVLGIQSTDQIFPLVASQYMGVGVGVVFLIGLVSASYPSTGWAITSLTTSFCMDFLSFDKRVDWTEKDKKRKRIKVHGFFAFLLFLLVMIFYYINNDAVINTIYKMVSYTYGPLIGLFSFGIFMKCKIRDRYVPYIAILSPVISFFINILSKKYLNFDLGFSLLVLNGLIAFIGLYLLRIKKKY